MKLCSQIYLLLILLIPSACSENSGKKINLTPAKNYNEVRFAKRFDINKKDGYTILTITDPWQGAKGVSQEYFLIPDSIQIPTGIDSAKVIRVPLKKIICTSTTHLSMISKLDCAETIKGFSGAGYIFEERLNELVRTRNILEVGYDDNLNKELVITIAPDLVMIYGIGSESSGYISKLREIGIRILYNADYLETDPLGKAEWIKVFGVLYGKEEKADSIFNSLSEDYINLKTYIAANIKMRPSVLLGLPFKDTWFISPGNSHISRLISDAGGDYIWKDTYSEISMPYGIENVFIKALNTDFWLNPGSVNSLKEISAIDNRLGELPPFRNRKIYNNNNRVTAMGGNDYWEGGNISPQIILKDIAAIIHPELFPDYKLFFYKKIE